MKIVLAYSGGLDTSVALKWLQDHYSAEVIAFCANIGQYEDIKEIESKAVNTGASKVYLEDLRQEYLQNYVFKALKAHAAYEGKYLLAAPLGRPLIAKRMVEIAHLEGADAVAHGATGKGNDQVRFYTSVVAHDPNLRVIAPVIEWEMKSRDDEIEYAKKHGINIPITSASPYSIDTNIWGTSIECGVLDDVTIPPPDDVYQITKSPLDAPNSPVELSIGFRNGNPISVDGEEMDSVKLVSLLNDIGKEHGVGRVDIIENRLVGIKTRGVYESPAGSILHLAHRELENLVLDRETLHFKELISQRYSELVYYGQWFSDLRESFDAFIDHTQQYVEGDVAVRLFKGNVTVMGRKSEHAMYDYKLSTYDTQDIFDHKAGQGFSYIWSMPLRVRPRSNR